MVAVVVHKKGQDIEVCGPCWSKIGDKDWEVGDDPRPTIEEIFHMDTGEPYEYLGKGKGVRKIGSQEEPEIPEQNTEEAEEEV